MRLFTLFLKLTLQNMVYSLYLKAYLNLVAKFPIVNMKYIPTKIVKLCLI